MLSSQAYAIISLLAGATAVNAHGYVYSWTVNGETRRGTDAGDSNGSGAARGNDQSSWGPADRNTGQVACGSNSAGSGLETWEMDAGSQVVAQWTHPKNGNTVWPPEHLGPVIDWMAKCPGDSCDGVAADSLDWFKIQEATWDGSEWPSAKINQDADWTINIPSDIAPGAYLVRTEIVAMHFEWAKKGFEVYPNCFQANVVGSGSAAPADTATFPEVYTPAEYEWYDYSYPWDSRAPEDYVPPGPAVYSGGGAPAPSSGGSSGSASSSAATEPSATGGAGQPSASGSASAPAPAPTDENTTPTGGDDDETVPEPTASDDEETTSPTSAPEEPSSAPSQSGSGGSSASSSRTRGGWWRNWRSSRTSTAAAAVETEADEGEGAEDDEEYSAERRNIIARYAPRQLAGF